MFEIIQIRVRPYAQTYIATVSDGMRASCTAGRQMAAERLAEKLAKGRRWELTETTEEGAYSYYLLRIECPEDC